MPKRSPKKWPTTYTALVVLCLGLAALSLATLYYRLQNNLEISEAEVSIFHGIFIFAGIVAVIAAWKEYKSNPC